MPSTPLGLHWGLLEFRITVYFVSPSSGSWWQCQHRRQRWHRPWPGGWFLLRFRFRKWLWIWWWFLWKFWYQDYLYHHCDQEIPAIEENLAGSAIAGVSCFLHSPPLFLPSALLVSVFFPLPWSLRSRMIFLVMVWPFWSLVASSQFGPGNRPLR